MRSSYILHRICRTIMTGLSDSSSNGSFVFNFQKVLVLTKTTRFDLVQYFNPSLSEKQVKELIVNQGLDLDEFLSKHLEHKRNEKSLLEALHNLDIQVKHVNRFSLKTEDIEWADTVISLGGDGTFLAAAQNVKTPDKVVLGFNSNPDDSTGYLCLPKFYTNEISKTLRLIKQGQFSWLMRNRIRVTLHKECDDKLISVDTKCLKSSKKYLLQDPDSLLDYSIPQHSVPECDSLPTLPPDGVLPYLALNEVFVGERLASRVSYLAIKRADGKYVNTKSSGLIVCTGSGSTSWNYTVNYLSPETLQRVFNLCKIHNLDTKSIAEIYNKEVIFKPDDPRLFYTIRDLIPTANWNVMPDLPNKGFTERCTLKTSCIDAGIVIDGDKCYRLPPGTRIDMISLPSDSLRTIILSEKSKD